MQQATQLDPVAGGRGAPAERSEQPRALLARPSEEDRISQETFEKVERAKREWEATADALSDLICLLDEEGHILRSNRAVEAWGLGNVQDVIGRRFHQLLHPACTCDHCALDVFLSRARASALRDQPEQQETYDETLRRFLHIRVRPVKEQHGVAPRTSVVVVQDITERKQAEQALQSYTARLETMNELGQAILAARSPEQIAQAALSRIRRLVPYVWASVALFKPDPGEYVVLAADTVDNWDVAQDRPSLPPQNVSFSVPLIAEAEFIGRMDLRAAETRPLTQEHRAIAREVASLLSVAIFQAHLYRQLEQANRELRDAIRAKDEMIQNVSHELRTPLTIIKGYTDLLREGGLGGLSEDQETAIWAIDTHSQRLTEMVNNLLTLQSLSWRRVSKSYLDLKGLIAQTARHWQMRFQAAEIELRLEIEAGLPDLFADADLLSQVLYNLLDNALKFSQRGSEVVIRAYAEQGEHVLVVSDRGIGISPDKLDKVFERFYQVDGGVSRSYGGMGIGLALCRKIVESHGGRIWVESPGEGQGSTFYVTLPSRPATTAVTPQDNV